MLEQARALGIVLSADGGKLRYEAPAGRLTPELRAALVANKAAILDLLETESAREDFEERAAIMEFDGGLSRDEAERTAWTLVSTDHRIH